MYSVFQSPYYLRAGLNSATEQEAAAAVIEQLLITAKGYTKETRLALRQGSLAEQRSYLAKAGYSLLSHVHPVVSGISMA